MERRKRILRLPEVIALTGLSRSSIYKRIDDGTFPRQVCLGGRAVGWWEHEIQKWLTTLQYVGQGCETPEGDDED